MARPRGRIVLATGAIERPIVVRRQRPAGRDARRRCARLPRALRRLAAGDARSSCHDDDRATRPRRCCGADGRRGRPRRARRPARRWATPHRRGGAPAGRCRRPAAVSGGWNPRSRCGPRPAARLAATSGSAAFVRGRDWERAGRRGGRRRRAARRCRPRVVRPGAGDEDADHASSTSSATRPSPTSAARSAPACARSSTSSATRRSAPAPTRARPRACWPSPSPPSCSARSSAPSASTTFRPPYVPVPFALLAGRDRGDASDPVRTTPIHAWHVDHGAVFEDVGQWKRPWYFPRDGEDMDAAVLRECAAARDAWP